MKKICVIIFILFSIAGFVSAAIAANTSSCIVACKIKGLFGSKHLYVYSTACGLRYPMFHAKIMRHKILGEPVIWVKCAGNDCGTARRKIVRYYRVNKHLPWAWNKKTL